MSRYILIRRLRGPAFLLLVGVNALLNQSHVLSWWKSWPLYLILAGVLLLAERAALAAEGGYPPAPNLGAKYPGPQYPGPQYPGPQYGNPNYPTTGSGIAPYQQTIPTTTVPPPPKDYDKDPFGGKS